MLHAVCFRVKPVGKPDAIVPHVRFDERGWETKLYATAPVLDSTVLFNTAIVPYTGKMSPVSQDLNLTQLLTISPDSDSAGKKLCGYAFNQSDKKCHRL